MSDYRRWISYIYSYENGVKKDSAGYARLELNDGKIRMTIFLNPGKRSGSAKVCCYKSRPEPPTAVFLGDFDLNASSPVFRKECDSSDMEGSGLFFQELNGLLLFGDDGSCLASSWEDEPLAPWEAEEIRRQLMERESGSADLQGNQNEAGIAERIEVVSGGSREGTGRGGSRAAERGKIASGGSREGTERGGNGAAQWEKSHLYP
ncbi:MAG: hypothetical protein K2N94_15145 [Lachnospiraceae bacterium]|nr:hypothetical protein [Lachnospiraceae bacterium]